VYLRAHYIEGGAHLRLAANEGAAAGESLSFGALLRVATVEKAGIRTLKKFNEHTIVSLEAALQRAAGRPFALTAAQRRQLAVLGLRDPSLEVQEMERS
jgi:hypothetical protein